MKRLLVLLFFFLPILLNAFPYEGWTERQLINKLGNPLAIIESTSRKLLQFPERALIIENGRVVRSLPYSMVPEKSPEEIIIHDAEDVHGLEPIGLIATQDAVVRGGFYRTHAAESMDPDTLSLSGFPNHFPQPVQESRFPEELSQIRKIYLSFKAPKEVTGEAVLILHTNERWNFESAYSPIIHVFGVHPLLNSSPSSTQWSETRIDWATAFGNSKSNGVNLRQTLRLTSDYFPTTNPFGIGENEQIRLRIGNVTDLIMPDGTIQLIVAQSSESVVSFYSKDALVDDRFKPRLVLK